jgi:hypothetical protein
VTATVVVVRFIWTWPAMWITHRLSNLDESGLPNRQVFYLAWCGMRGGISLAAALSLSEQVPSRLLITFMTACVIAGTLIVQGGPLPFLIRWLKLDEDARGESGESAELERKARIDAIESALERLEGCGEKADRIRDEYEHRLDMLRRSSDESEIEVGPAGYARESVKIRLRALRAEREKLLGLHREGGLPEHVLHRIERDLDL